MPQISIQNNLAHSKKRKYKSKSMKLKKKDLITVTEHAPDIICRFDTSCRLLYVNPAIELATGIPTHAFLHKTTRELGMPEEHSQNWEEKISYVVATCQQTTLEFPFLTPAGLRFFHTLLVPEFTDDGSVATVLTISRDITDKKEMDRKKDEEVSFVSHELKTPVTSLKISTQMLKRKFAKEGDNQTAAYLEKMDRQINKLTDIISNLMDATRIDQAAMRLKKEKFNMNALVKEVVEEVQKTSALHKIEIHGKSKKTVFADRTRIGQVITNLLTNAIRYSPDSLDVIITVSSDSENVYCSVRDFGIGIPKEQKEKIFGRFYRVTDIEAEFHMGLGLGLYISSEIIKRHRGKIWVDSELGKGSTFFFSLPIP